MKHFFSELFLTVRENDNDALVPELWAQETLEQLEKEMIMGMLVHRDFSEAIAAFGDTVNAHRPLDVTASTKRDKQKVKTSNAKTVNVPVKLNQWVHNSILLGDGEVSKSFKDLIDLYIAPQARSVADRVDQVLLAQAYQFMSNHAGNLSQSLSVATILEARKIMQTNKVDGRDRRFITGPNGEADLLNIDKFTDANTVGDDGTAMREGHVGRKYGFDFFHDQNVSSIADADAADLQVYATSAAVAKGASVVALSAGSGSGIVTVGSWVTIAGDNIPHQITAQADNATDTTSITISPALVAGVGSAAEVVAYKPALVNQSSTALEETDFATGYPLDYNEVIAIDGVTGAPQLGQLVSFGGQNYGLVGEASATAVELDRPVESALADNQPIFLGPSGEYSFAFHKNALALVTRPLAQPTAGTGARTFVASYNGLTMRATISYDGGYQCTRVTLDLLCGVKALNTAMGVIVYSQ